MKNSIGLLELVILVCFFAFNSCKPNTECPPSSKVYYKNLILKAPYQVNDSIMFTDSIGNELNFSLSKINIGFVDDYDNIGLDCGEYLHKYQFTKYYFREKNNKVNLWIGNYMKTDTLFFKDAEQTLYIGINEDNFWFSSNQIQNHYGNTTETELNGIKYYNLRHENYNNNELYYSKEFGLVCFRTNNVNWFLKK